MRAILQTMAKILERAEIVDPEVGVRGYVDEQLVTFQLRMASVGSVTAQWTEAEVPAPPGLRVNFSIRPRTGLEARQIETGLALDLRLDDPSFEAAYLVEGAPLRLVRAIVDDEVRRALVALQPDEVMTTETALIIKLPGWVEDGERAALLVRTAARIGSLCAEIARRELAGVGPSDTSGYRGLVAPGTHARDREELAALDHVRERRAEAQRKDAIHAVIAVGVFLAALGVALSRCDQ